VDRPYYKYPPGHFAHLPPAVCTLVLHPWRRGRLLMIQRALHDAGGGFWTPVTGGCHDGETPQQTMVREVYEEVGLRVAPIRKLWECPTSHFSHVLHWWTARLEPGPMGAGTRPDGVTVRPSPAEVHDFRWVTPTEAERLEPMFVDTAYFLAHLRDELLADAELAAFPRGETTGAP
jgi:8-oxo-dGTP diphosphatase